MDLDERQRSALGAAEAWLASIDERDAETTWQGAATLFRGAVTPESWSDSLAKVQGALGLATSRALASAETKTEMPGAPDGEYVVFKFTTSFERKEHGEETVVPMLDDDGEWRVSGYFVK